MRFFTEAKTVCVKYEARVPVTGGKMSMFDWISSEQKLYESCVAEIKRFVIEQPNAQVCCFAFDTEPRYGYVILAFDTLENNLRSCRELERSAVERNTEWLTERRHWQSATHFLTSPALPVFDTNSGNFAYSQFAEVRFPEWTSIAESDNYPQRKEHEDEYLDSNVRIVLWNVAQRLVEGRAFDTLRKASPFVIAYCIHDEEDAILRILNWPNPV